MKVIDAIAEIMKQESVQFLSCYPTTPIIEACASVGIRPYLCRQERVGAGIADGYSRVTNGKPIGVFAMQYGPGAENGPVAAGGEVGPALEETGGDLDAARTLLRERGMASAGKRAGRETTEGLVGYVVDRSIGGTCSPSAVRSSLPAWTAVVARSPLADDVVMHPIVRLDIRPGRHDGQLHRDGHRPRHRDRYLPRAGPRHHLAMGRGRDGGVRRWERLVQPRIQ